MGITLEVGSITVAPADRKGVRPPYLQLLEARLQKIIRHFNWEKTTWQEPSTIKGSVDTSFSSRTFLFLSNLAEKARNKSGTIQFEQLLTANAYNLYYLPIADSITLHLLDDDGEKFFVGSSIILHGELLVLVELVHDLVEQNGENTLLGISNDTHTWKNLYEVCHSLLQATIESQALNLPIYITM
jgi:hypothetical protein